MSIRRAVYGVYSKPDPWFLGLVGLLNYDVRVQILGLFLRALGADVPCRCPYDSEWGWAYLTLCTYFCFFVVTYIDALSTIFMR